MPAPKKYPSGKPGHSRNSKRLLLPLPREDAEKVVLRCRLALEQIRCGNADRRAADLMASTLLLTAFLTEAGHGLLPMPMLRETEQMLFNTLDAAGRTGAWEFSAPLVSDLLLVVNEHDRQLRETRLQAVIDASARLDRYIDKQRSEAEKAGSA